MRLFYCYSKNLRDYFKENGIRYLNTNVNQSTNKRYWLYEGTKELNDLLAIWRNNRNK